MTYRNNDERLKYVVDTINNIIEFDCQNYLQKVFSLDAIILNDDRHFHNLGFIQDDDGSFKEAPIFDNGRGLLSDLSRYPNYNSLTANKKLVVGSPICANLETQAALVGFNFSLKTSAFMDWINAERIKYDESLYYKRAFDVLESQINYYFLDETKEKPSNTKKNFIEIDEDEELEYY